MPAATRALAFAPIYTASSWSTLIESTAKAAHDRNGDLEVPAIVDLVARVPRIPRLTNRDALALIFAWRGAAAPVPGTFPLWASYAAPAFGWEQDGDALLVDDDQAAKQYPSRYVPSLWLQLSEVAKALDNARRDNPAIAVVDLWNDSRALGDVAGALADDNVDASFKHPMPYCRDKKTGKLRFPKPCGHPDCEMRMVAGLPRCVDKRTGKICKLSDPDCEIVMQDDPLTAIAKAIAKLLGRAAKPLAVVGVVYVGLTVLDRRRARRKGRKKRHGNAKGSRRVLA